MKHIKIILGLVLFASVSTFAQSPRIKLNQITKDTVKGSVLISSPSDSGMVYSRDFYVAYGADTVLILYGDTLAATSGIISSVLSDGVTITGNGTSGNELKVDTLLIATIKALNDSLATISASTTPDNVTITGDGSVGNPLKVDTLLISTIKGLNDTLTNRGYLTSEVDGSVSNELQTISTSGAAGNITLSDGGGTLNLNVDDADASATNEGSLTVGAGTASTSVISSNTSGSTDVTLTAGSNITLSETGNNITIAATGGGASYNNISETADTVFITGDLNVDANTLRVDATNNSVGIGTSTPTAGFNMEISGSRSRLALLNTSGNTSDYSQILFGNGIYTGEYAEMIRFNNTKEWSIYNQSGDIFFSTNVSGGSYRYDLFIEESNGNVGIGTSLPSAKLELKSGNSLSGTFKEFSIYDSNGDLRSTINNVGTQEWYLHNTVNNVGKIAYATPSGFPGIVTWTGTTFDQNRFDIVNYGSTFRFYYNANGATSGLNIASSGNIGIATTAPSYKLHVNGSVAGVGAYNALSDVNYKKNINDLELGLDIVKQLRPITYNWINEEYGTRTNIGFIAQEVESILPNIITASDDNVKSMATTDLIPILTKAIQEQQVIIETQATEIDQLKTLITDLTNRLIILENK